MHVISRRMILEFTKAHADAAAPLDAWYRTTKRALWTSRNEVRATYPHADMLGTCVIFNIGGNKYRLITHIAFAAGPVIGQTQFKGKVFILHVLTHKEYDTARWKKDCGC
jgi:mRNA interferase HigB